MIKAIIFDYFGVVSSSDYWRYIDETNLARPQFSHIVDEVNLGKVDWGDFLREVAAITNQSVADVSIFYAQNRIDPRIIKYVYSLKPKFKVAILTNANYDYLEPIIKQAGLGKLFDKIIISSKLGLIKPDQRIYSHTLKELSIKSEEAIFIDNSEDNTNAAASLGVHTVAYKNFDSMKLAIEKILKKFNQSEK